MSCPSDIIRNSGDELRIKQVSLKISKFGLVMEILWQKLGTARDFA